MPKVTVHAFATLSDLISKRLEVITSAVTLLELIDFIAKEHNPKFKEQVIDPQTGKVKDFFKIFVNGRDNDFLNGLETKLQDGDNIAFFQLIGGG